MQPQPTHVIRPMPKDIPAFEIAPLERAKTDRAANERAFAADGESRLNIPMLLVAVIGIGVMIVAACAALYGVFVGVLALVGHAIAHPLGYAIGGAVSVAVLIAAWYVKQRVRRAIVRAARLAHARRNAQAADAMFGELK